MTKNEKGSIRSAQPQLPFALSTMEALRLQKKFPEVTRDEMFDLINRFKYVYSLY